ncbi:MAG: hypothetical protein IJC99_01115 [Clostridia bacterium]|nr:hypothetical protein [Clostridia bacterium]
MLFDLHAHSGEISKCCRIPACEVLRRAREVRLDGIVLTNHYQKSYVPDGDYAAFAAGYVSAFEQARYLGEEMGVRVFFGVEVTMEKYAYVHLLIYGVTTDFLLDHPTLFDETQEGLYRLVQAAGGIVVQAHPYRHGEYLLDTKYLDGVEISCHPLYKSGTQLYRLADIAAEQRLILTCGGDYHADTYRPCCGVYLPDDINDSVALGQYLKKTEKIRLLVQEVDGSPAHAVTFSRGGGLEEEEER